MMIKHTHKDKGSIAIMTAIVLTFLLGVGALATDMAVIYAKKSDLQNAVDSSVLAAAQDLPDNPGTAYTTAVQYANNNDTTLSSIEFSHNNRQIAIRASRNVPLFFARVLGIDSSTVSAQASAQVISARSIKGVAPLSITMQEFVYGQEYTLKNGAGDGENGWYGPVRLDGSGANLYRDALLYGNDSPMYIGQILGIESGNMSGPTKQGLNDRLASDTRIPANTFDNHDNNAPQILYVPIVEVVTRNSDKVTQVRILGFAAFFVEDVTSGGNDCFITGRFLRTIVTQGRETSPLSPDEDDPLTDYGLYSIKLMN